MFRCLWVPGELGDCPQMPVVPVELGLEDSDRLERFFSPNPFARLARDSPFMAVWDPG